MRLIGDRTLFEALLDLPVDKTNMFAVSAVFGTFAACFAKGHYVPVALVLPALISSKQNALPSTAAVIPSLKGCRGVHGGQQEDADRKCHKKTHTKNQKQDDFNGRVDEG